MDINCISQVMDYSGQDGYCEVGALCESEQDIISHMKEMYPFFDTKAYLLEALDRLNKYSPAIGSHAENLFNYMIGIGGVKSYGVGVIQEDSSYVHTNPDYLGKLHIWLTTSISFDIDSFREKYNVSHVFDNSGEGPFYVELCIDIPHPEKVVSDTQLIGEYKNIFENTSSGVILVLSE